MSEWLRAINETSIPFILWFQGFETESLTGFMRLMSWLGHEYFYILFFPFLYWVVNKRWGALTGLALIVSLYCGELLKWVFKLPRPPAPPVEVWWHETSPGFVSTHASATLAILGTLAVLVRRWWFTVIAALLIFLIGLSRLYLGVHFPADVIGGWVVGLFAMWAALWLAPKVTPVVVSWSTGRQVAGTLILAAILLLVYPGNWDGNRPAQSGFRDVSLLTGFLLGLIWDVKQLHFRIDGVWWLRLIRFVVGVVVLVVVFLGFDIFFDMLAPDSYFVQQALRFVRYGMVGFTVSGLGPWVFQKTRLAETR